MIYLMGRLYNLNECSMLNVILIASKIDNILINNGISTLYFLLATKVAKRITSSLTPYHSHSGVFSK